MVHVYVVWMVSYAPQAREEHVHVYPDLHVHAHVHVFMVPPMILGVIDTSAWCYDSYLRFIMHYSAEPSAP